MSGTAPPVMSGTAPPPRAPIALSRGRQLTRPGVADGLCRVVGPDGALVAVGEVLAGRLRPVRVITAPVVPGVLGAPRRS